MGTLICTYVYVCALHIELRYLSYSGRYFMEKTQTRLGTGTPVKRGTAGNVLFDDLRCSVSTLALCRIHLIAIS